MREPILFPDLESLLIDLLTETLGIEVGAQVPADLTVNDTHLRVVRLGGTSRDLVVDQPTISLEARAPGRTAAYTLISEARAHLHSLIGATDLDHMVYDVRELAGPAFQPDPDTRHPRYVLNAQVSTKGAALTGS